MNINPEHVIEALRAQVANLVVEVAMRDAAILDLQTQLAERDGQQDGADI